MFGVPGVRRDEGTVRAAPQLNDNSVTPGMGAPVRW
jgi:hypothetical protein